MGKIIYKFFEFLRNYSKIIIDFEKKIMLPLNKKELESHQDAKAWVRDHCNYTGKFNVFNEIPAILKMLKLWLSFYDKRISKWVWGEIWMSWEKHRKVQHFLLPI